MKFRSIKLQDGFYKVKMRMLFTLELTGYYNVGFQTQGIG